MVDDDLIEKISRKLCELKGIEADIETSAFRDITKKVLPLPYKLWQYQAKFNVEPILEMLKEEDKIDG